MRAHFGFVLNTDDPRACTTGYLSDRQTRSPGAVANLDTDPVACDVINGVDPNPGDGDDESGSDIRGEQNIGRSGGDGAHGPQSRWRCRALPGSTRRGAAGDVLGQLLHANPFATHRGLTRGTTIEHAPADTTGESRG